MTTAGLTNEATVRLVLQSLVRGELAAARGHLDPDLVYNLHAYQKTVRGADQFVAFLSGYYGQAANFRSDIHELLASGDSVAIRGREAYDMNGAHVEFDYASWVRLADGKIVEWSDYFDSRIVGRQMKQAG